jgi:hypothetical protein
VCNGRPRNGAGGFNARKTYLDQTCSGRRKQAKDTGTPTEERFLLKVDGQVKCSFGRREDAASAGAKIKKAYPIVVVTVVDTKDGTTEIIGS